MALKLTLDIADINALQATLDSKQIKLKPGTNITIGTDGTISSAGGTSILPQASATILGGVKVGTNLAISSTGVLSATKQTFALSPASSTVLGGVKIGAGLAVAADGTLSVTATNGSSYILSQASNSVLGGIKIGPGLSISSDGTVSVIGNGGAPTTTVYGSIKSVKEFGAKGDGGTDDSAAINAAVQYCLTNSVRTLYFPEGSYSISKPILLRNKNTAFSTINLVGESNMWSSAQGSIIIPTYNDTFAIGIQLGKATTIEGLTLRGKFQPQTTKFFSTAFAEWGSGARDSRYSPYSGIAIDYATNFGGVPSDGGYPGLSAEYGVAPDRGTGGSTGIRIKNCVINNYVVGIACSPNGQTQNNEEITIDFVDFTNCKTAVAGGQSQEKNNVLSNFATWGGTHTVFSQGVYGSPGHAGNWIIQKGNLAGQVVQIIEAWAAAWFPTYIREVFAESLLKFGTYGTQMNAHISDSHFDFVEPEYYETGYQPIIKAWGMVKFDNCVFRYYNGAVPGYPMVISGGIYDTCTFGGTPVDVSAGDAQAYYGSIAEFYNCGEDGYGVGTRKIGEIRKNIPVNNDLNITTHNRYGDFSFQDGEGGVISFQGNKTSYALYLEKSVKTVKLSNLGFTFTSDNPQGYFVNQLVVIGQNYQGYGIVKKIEGNIITIGASTPTLNGDYPIFAVYPNHASVAFTGDVTGANEISNIRPTWGVAAGAVNNIFVTQAGVFRVASYDSASNRFKTFGILPGVQLGYNFK